MSLWIVFNNVYESSELAPGFGFGAWIVVDSLKKLNVKYISPSHCTGGPGISIFREKWGDNFKDLFLGMKLEIK